MTTWVVRSGRQGERDQWCLTNGVAGGGWHEWPDLTGTPSREAMRAIVDQVKPDAKPGARAGWASQLWAFLHIAPGDLVIMPMKTTKTLALGVCTKGYHYVAAEPEPTKRHRIGVDWKRDDVPRSAIKQDLLYTLGALATIFSPSRNEAAARFRAVMETGEDPGSAKAASPSPTAQQEAAENELSDPVAVPTLETIRDRVRTHLSENFKGHSLTELIADILRTRGFTCDVSPPGRPGCRHPGWFRSARPRLTHTDRRGQVRDRAGVRAGRARAPGRDALEPVRPGTAGCLGRNHQGREARDPDRPAHDEGLGR